jgi:hypothetical protein
MSKTYTKKSILLLLILFFQISFAQKQNNQWRYGGAGAIDFNTVPPSFVTGCVIVASEGSASVADRITGALLFYTDGVTVWNANNQVMPNGTGLLGGDPILLSSTTAAVIIPKPGSSNLYYIVTVHELLAGIGVACPMRSVWGCSTCTGAVGPARRGCLWPRRVSWTR